MKIKKYVKILTILCMLLVSITSHAKVIDIKLIMDGKTITYKQEEIVLKINGEVTETKAMPPIILDGRTLVPAREVFEKLGATVNWDDEFKMVKIALNDTEVRITINSQYAYVLKNNNFELIKTHELDVPAKIINDKTMIPVRFVSEALNYKVEWDDPTRTVNIVVPKQEETKPVGEIDIKKETLVWENKANISMVNSYQKSIKPMDYSDAKITNINAEKTTQGMVYTIIGSDKISDVNPSVWDDKLIIDIKNAVLSNVQISKTALSNDWVMQTRTSQFETNPNAVRVVFDLRGLVSYNVELSENRKEIKVTLYKNDVYKFSFTETSGGSTAVIESILKPNVDSFRLTNPDRIVVDVKNSTTELGYKTATLSNSKLISNVKTSQFDENTTRFVFDTSEQADFEIKYTDNKVTVDFKQSGYSNIEYDNYNNYKINIDKKAVGTLQVKEIEILEDYLNGNYVVTLPKDYTSILGKGRLTVSDSRVNAINIYLESGKTKIKVETNQIIAIKAYEDASNITLEIVRPGDKYEYVIVIDAGHGGTDPGAEIKTENGKYQEKEYNLKIANKVAEELAKTEVKAYLARPTDDYVTRPDRAEMANTIGAKFLISIHNNSMPGNNSVKGTETLYYEDGKTVNGISNKKLAEIFLENIVKKVGTINRGVKQRDDLELLKLTKIPMTLIECAYMTNEEDMNSLNTASFIDTLAKTIANAVVQVFNNYGL